MVDRPQFEYHRYWAIDRARAEVRCILNRTFMPSSLRQSVTSTANLQWNSLSYNTIVRWQRLDTCTSSWGNLLLQQFQLFKDCICHSFHSSPNLAMCFALSCQAEFADGFCASSCPGEVKPAHFATVQNLSSVFELPTDLNQMWLPYQHSSIVSLRQ